jgi:hypothetical protein
MSHSSLSAALFRRITLKGRLDLPKFIATVLRQSDIRERNGGAWKSLKMRSAVVEVNFLYTRITQFSLSKIIQ